MPLGGLGSRGWERLVSLELLRKWPRLFRMERERDLLRGLGGGGGIFFDGGAWDDAMDEATMASDSDSVSMPLDLSSVLVLLLLCEAVDSDAMLGVGIGLEGSRSCIMIPWLRGRPRETGEPFGRGRGGRAGLGERGRELRLVREPFVVLSLTSLFCGAVGNVLDLGGSGGWNSFCELGVGDGE